MKNNISKTYQQAVYIQVQRLVYLWLLLSYANALKEALAEEEDMPHGFEWKGVFMDAGLRRIELTAEHAESAEGSSGSLGVLSDLGGEKRRLFMQLSALQGSVLENRVFEDDLKVESISTAKLLQLSNSTNTQLITIDKTNIASILPTLNLDEAIKEDIVNSVNQNLTIRIPQSEIAYQNWTGIGYIKENTQTGEAGYMLSGMIAGGMTAQTPEQWVDQHLAGTLSQPYTGVPNSDTQAAASILKIPPTDQQIQTVNKQQTLAVLVKHIWGRCCIRCIEKFEVIIRS